jgi:hypothetical protein
VTATLGSGSPNQRVSIFATVNGAKSMIAEGDVGPDGTLTVDHVITDGTRFTAEYDGDETYAPASASKDVGHLLRNATVSLTSDESTYTYGETATLTVRLRTASSNRTVGLYRAVGDKLTLIRTGQVPADGVWTASIRMEDHSKLYAGYDGDEGTNSDTARVILPVAARVSESLLDFDGRSGKYHLYQAGDRVPVRSSVSPDHSGQCTYFRIQYLRDGFFRDHIVTGCRRIDATSESRMSFASTREARGHAIRIRSEWRGDSRNMAATSGWQYIRFT